MTIGLVGRTNVGKSTLFNRLIGTFRAIVTDIAGTTRELLREKCIIDGNIFELVDSPGLERFSEEKKFIQQIIDESDVILFVVDGKVPLGEQDFVIRDMIIKSGKKENTIVIVNKLDGKVYDKHVLVLLADYYVLGFEDIIPLSAKEEEGVMLVAEALGERRKKGEKGENNESCRYSDEGQNPIIGDTEISSAGQSFIVHLAIVGRPNVGKSTLLNSLIGEEIAWVQDKPGTTLDYITAEFLRKDKKINLYDTAGIRKKGKTVGLEKIAYMKTLKMIERVKPIVVVLIDLEEGLTHRDKSLIGELVEKGVGLIVALNKRDVFTEKEIKIFEKKIRHNLALDRIPLVKISGKEKIGLSKLLDEVFRIQKEYNKYIATAKLNKVLKNAWIEKPPRFPKNKICKRKYITQVGIKPPTFFLSVNNKEYANFSFVSWIEKVLRKNFGFRGVPLKIKFGSKVEKNPYVK